MPDSAFRDIDTLVVNETEAQILSGRAETAELDLDDVASKFLGLGVRSAVVVTLGSAGVYYATKDKRGRVPAKKVNVVDTTAAGDTFLGAYAAHMAETAEFDIEKALQFATAASAVTVQRKGAMAAIPRRAEVEGY